jgi:hypothetical protein
VEAIRFKVQWGKVKNINHAVSRGLGIAVGALILIWWGIAVLLCNWWSLLAVGITALSFVGIRFALYDPFLNIFRLLFGINPTGRIDYVSTQTSSYEDQHSEKVTFWWKRVIGGAGWAAMYFLYKIIFKV